MLGDDWFKRRMQCSYNFAGQSWCYFSYTALHGFGYRTADSFLRNSHDSESIEDEPQIIYEPPRCFVLSDIGLAFKI